MRAIPLTSVIEEITVVVVRILSIGDGLVFVTVRNEVLHDERVGTINFPAILRNTKTMRQRGTQVSNTKTNNSEIQNAVHLRVPPGQGVGVRVIKQASLSVPPLQSRELTERIGNEKRLVQGDLVVGRVCVDHGGRPQDHVHVLSVKLRDQASHVRKYRCIHDEVVEA